ncbi:MAG: mechanosensitive ion channel domain-containing protein [Kiloniellales bacterium]
MRAVVRPLLVAIALVLPGAPALGQDERPFGFRLTDWNQTLSEVEAAAERPDLTAAEVNALRDRLARVRQEALGSRNRAESALQPLRQQLGTLGAAPAEGEPPESPDIGAQRQSLNERIASLQDQIKQIGLITTKVQELDSRFSAYAREQAVSEILKPYPLPIAPSTIAVSVPEMFGILGRLVQAPISWWDGLTSEQRIHILLYRLLLGLGLIVAIGWLLRRLLLRAFGRDPESTAPTYARRVVAAVAEGLADGLIPALILGGILERVASSGVVPMGVFRDMVMGFCISAMIFVLSWAFARAALAPDLPSWRLENIQPENAKRIARAISLLAALFAVDLFLTRSTAGLPISDELASFYELVTSVVEAAIVVYLTRSSLWVPGAADAALADQDADDEAAVPSGRASRFWLTVRVALRSIAIAAIVAAIAGYAGLAGYLMSNLLATGVVGGPLFLIRGLLRELIGGALRADLVQSELGLRHRTRNLLKFWLRTLLDLAILLIGLLIVLPIWGVPARDMLIWTSGVLQGFTIGNVTISVTDALIGIGVFAGVLIATRLLQRLLAERVLPQTTLDSGVQNSLAAGFGYIGLILAAALAISAIGLDLSNVALIAGALSVGIGFGLQNVVNNFVSGLILLVERPIKVGDWIVAAGHEGYVKRINVRATELETFQRASVIIPNSELISTSVINYTHKNKLGRIEVKVGVAYGSDVEKVMRIMKEPLVADSRIAEWPEPYVLFRGFGDSSLDFEGRGYLLDVESIMSVSSDYRVALAKAFAENGIEIPFPQRDLHLKDIDRLVEAISHSNDAAAERQAARRQFNEPPGKAAEERAAAPGDGKPAG